MLRRRLEGMPNEEYQRMLRVDSSHVAERIVTDSESGPEADALRDLVTRMPAAEVAAAVRDLGGHDLGLLADTFTTVAADRPTVVFAYTVKGRGLPTEGHPNNHSALLSGEQMDVLAADSGVERSTPLQRFPADSTAGRLCEERRTALRREPVTPTTPLDVPTSLGHAHRKPISTQAALGRLLADLPRDAPDTAARVVTCSPDVASSTNLGGWINKTGVWSVSDRRDWFADDNQRLLRWHEVTNGQHIELGIAEVNLVSLLGELGATWSRWGERLIPVATLYDPFVSRGPGAMVVRNVCGRTVDPRRHPLGGDPRTRRRSPSVDHHAFDRARAAGMRRVGAGLRPGPGVVPPARDGAGGGRGRHLGLLPPLDAAHRSRPRPAAG